MKRIESKLLIPVLAMILAGCGSSESRPGQASALAEFRKGFVSEFTRKEADHSGRAVAAPRELYDTIRYPAPLGEQEAYVSVDPKDGRKHPAIIWISGSFRASLQPVSADRLKPFAAKGIVGMVPSLRGGNANPGHKEYFLGELDDIVAAADYLARLPYVDKNRIYLGGTSTGGTTALLAAEYTDRFRAVFAYGPSDEVSGYGQEILPFDCKNPRETKARSPIHWLDGIRTKTWVMEGDVEGNVESLNILRTANHNPRVRFFVIPGVTHRKDPDAMNPLVAQCIAADSTPECSIALDQGMVDGAAKAYLAETQAVVPGN